MIFIEPKIFYQAKPGRNDNNNEDYRKLNVPVKNVFE